MEPRSFCHPNLVWIILLPSWASATSLGIFSFDHIVPYLQHKRARPKNLRTSHGDRAGNAWGAKAGDAELAGEPGMCFSSFILFVCLEMVLEMCYKALSPPPLACHALARPDVADCSELVPSKLYCPSERPITNRLFGSSSMSQLCDDGDPIVAEGR